MKISQFLPFVLLGALACPGLNQASAQAPASQSQLQKVRVVSSKVGNGRPVVIYVVAANDRGIKFKTTQAETSDTTLPLSDFERYFVLEPQEFRTAYDLYEDRKYAEAIKGFNSVAEMQKAMRDLPFNYSAFAEFYLAECSRRMMNVAEMEKIDTERLRKVLPMEGCLVQMDIIDLWKKSFKKDWAALQAGVQKILKDKKNLSSGQRAQLFYLLGLSYDGQNKAKDAIDALSEAMLIDGINSPEVSRSAVQKLLDIYMKSPEVSDFLKSNPAPDTKSVPALVREAAGVAGVWKNVFNFSEALPQQYQPLLPFRIEPPKPAPAPQGEQKQAPAAAQAKAPEGKGQQPAASAKPAGAPPAQPAAAPAQPKQ